MSTHSNSCPACRGSDVVVFYRQDGIPMNSMLLLDRAEEARAFPRGDLALGHCTACGFVTNTMYDEGSAEYSQRYEASQAFSGVFNRFATHLAERWIDRHDIRSKTVLEIGCDKGDFLRLICELGGNTGIGIDPAATPGRGDLGGRITYVADFYGPGYADLEADVVICRHTLEHIPDVLEFMQGVRTAIGTRTDTVVLFELPDVLRVLEEAAFWDVYYEHCSYFTLGSLARLFRRAGFDVIRLERDFDDQYLLIEARPTPAGRAPSHALAEEDDLEAIGRAVAGFTSAVERALDESRRLVSATEAEGGSVVIWGGGSKGVSYLSGLGATADISFAVDINPYKQGKYLAGGGQKVVAPEFLTEYQPRLVIAMNPIYAEEIRATLQSLGVIAELQSV